MRSLVGLLLAAVVIGLGACSASDQTTQAQVPAEVEQLIDDYLAAWEGRDEAAIRAVTADDFVLNEYTYQNGGLGIGGESIDAGTTVLWLHVDGYDVEQIISVSFVEEWQNELVGEPIITGNGPWIVSVEENWTLWEAHSNGIATYVIVEEDGSLKIANHLWAGKREYG